MVLANSVHEDSLFPKRRCLSNPGIVAQKDDGRAQIANKRFRKERLDLEISLRANADFRVELADKLRILQEYEWRARR